MVLAGYFLDIYFGMQGKRRGRPLLGSASKKSASLLLRLTESEKRTFADAADLAGIPLSMWIRERLRRRATVELEEAGRPIAFLLPSSGKDGE